MTPQLYLYLQSVRRFIGKHHPILFISLLCILLGAAIIALEQVFVASIDTSANPVSSTIAGFDQGTVDKIKQLHISSDTNNSLTFPSPRANPFAE